MQFPVNLKVWTVLILAFCIVPAYSQPYTVTSPNGSLTIRVEVSSVIEYEVLYDDVPLITPSVISLSLNTGLVLGQDATVESTGTRSVNEKIEPLYGKNKELDDHYNELEINFTQQYALILRAYDEGVAYRFRTALGGDVIVEAEEANFNFSGDPGVIFPEADADMRSWERAYDTYASLQEIPAGKFSVTPTMFSYPASGIRVVIAESDLLDYPGMYLQRNDGAGMKGKWAHYPKTVSEPDNVYAYHRVLEREDYLARTTGTRSYPWRVVIVSTEDKDLLNNELIYKLATPQVLTSTSWIKPGKSAWEWWHDAILETGHIPSGTDNLGYPLYKYYVDFAAQYQLEYITMDAGWSTEYAAQVCQYAASRNVKVFLWDYINLPVENPARLTQLKTIGAAGIKVDLIERDDQVAINWFEQLAKACAERELMIIFHGCAKPTGLQRTYPNIVNFEAVRGAECAKWDETPNPDYHLQFPFIRMLAGPLDYTPGSMRNVHRSEFEPVPKGIPMTMGTRAHELAMYVLFDQPLGYLCDSPTEYRKFPDVMDFLSRVPTTWDRTVPLSAEVGEYAVIAKQTGEEWYVAAMTNGEERDIEIDFSFLPEGEERTAVVLRDNEQTATYAKVCTREVITVNSQTKLNYHLASGGGLVMWIPGLITGTKTGRVEPEIWVYPNEDGTQLAIRSAKSIWPEIRSVTIVELSGRIRHREKISRPQPLLQIDTSALASGVYVARVETASEVHALKFIR